jgi:hypothetical protein
MLQVATHNVCKQAVLQTDTLFSYIVAIVATLLYRNCGMYLLIFYMQVFETDFSFGDFTYRALAASANLIKSSCFLWHLWRSYWRARLAI